MKKPAATYFTVDKIIDKKIKNKKHFYLVKWEGESEVDASWEPVKKLKTIRAMLRRFDSKWAKEKPINDKNTDSVISGVKSTSKSTSTVIDCTSSPKSK